MKMTRKVVFNFVHTKGVVERGMCIFRAALETFLEIISVGFDVTDQLLIRFSAFVRYWRKNGSTMRQYISYS
jgi:hypothetical protein